jgi:hypothetical protein
MPSTLPLPPPRYLNPLVSIKNNKGSTALHFACYEEHRSEESLLLAKALLLAGGESEVDVTDSRGMTPLLVCCTTGRYCVVLYCIILCSIVLYCIVLYCIVLHCHLSLIFTHISLTLSLFPHIKKTHFCI